MMAIGLVAMVAMTPRLQEPSAAPQVQTYQESALNLAFDYPKAWKTTKRGRDTIIITMPLENSNGTAELEVTRTSFHGSKEIWKTVQDRINEQLKRDVINQWEEQVLSVPLLLTQVRFEQKGIEMTSMSGLYYTRTMQKLLLKLTAASGDFQQAKYQFDQTLLSLRTIDGTTPEEDDENVDLKAIVPKPVAAPPKRSVLTEKNPSKTPNKAPTKATVAIPLQISTKDISLKVPEGWSGEVKEGGRVVLTSSELSGPFELEVRSTLDSEPPLNALFKLSSASLNDFTSVTKRTDTSGVPNSAKCVLTTVWRIGKKEGGDLMVHEVVGVQGSFYFIGQYRLTSAAALDSERRALARLLDVISLESGS